MNWLFRCSYLWGQLYSLSPYFLYQYVKRASRGNSSLHKVPCLVLVAHWCEYAQISARPFIGYSQMARLISFTPGYAVVSQWFLRYRSLALGISGAGACLGGAVTPILLQRLIPVIGFRWAVRVLAAMVFVCLSVSCALLKPRLPLTRKVRARDIVDLNGFKDVQYTLAAIGSFL